MRDADIEALKNEILELHFGCHEAPEELRRRIAADPELTRIAAEVDAEAALLERAAREPIASLALKSGGAQARRSGRWRALFSLRGLAAAAAILFLLLPSADLLVKSTRLKGLEAGILRIQLSGPPSVPAATAAKFHLSASGHDGSPRSADFDWTVVDKDDTPIAEGRARDRVQVDIPVDPRIGPATGILVKAHSGEETESLRFDLAPGSVTPMVHMATDKAAYRPGEKLRVRCVFLDRLSLEARDRVYTVRIAEPRDAATHDLQVITNSGVGALEWVIPPSSPGGIWNLELRSVDNSFALTRLPFLVREFRAPRLRSELVLDRNAYAPGAKGSASIRVERQAGGPAAGCGLRAALVIDGTETWNESRTADDQGRGGFSFAIPNEVAIGDGRFVVTCSDGGIVEPAIETFIVPTGKLEVHFHPEGGDLVRDRESRVYFEITDPAGRPADALGSIVDDRGNLVTRIETLHQGRGTFAIHPESGRHYDLLFDDPRAGRVALPEAREKGVVMRVEPAAIPAGADLVLDVDLPDGSPYVAAVFVRGTVVAQSTLEGAGRQTLRLPLDEEVAGVLRVTIFDSRLLPVAERLVRRATSRRIAVEISPLVSPARPGGHQEIEIRTRDENGHPIPATLGLSVSDRAVRDMTGEPRVGLVDAAFLAADLDEFFDLEDRAGFLGDDPSSRRNVDLLLGTRGWRRFGWRVGAPEASTLGEHGRSFLAREGRSDLPAVRRASNEVPAELARAADLRRAANDRFRFGLGLTAVVALGLVMVGLFRRPRTGEPSHVIRRLAVGLSIGTAVGLAAVIFLVNTSRLGRTEGKVAFLADFRMAGAVEAPREEDWGRALADLEVAPVARIEDLARDQILRFGIVDEPVFVDALGDFDGLVEEMVELEDEIEVDRQKIRAAFAREGRAGLLFAPADDRKPAADPDFEFRKEADAKVPEILRKLGEIETRGYRLSYVREYAHAHVAKAGAERSDFTETVYWNPLLRTDAEGRARIAFDVSDGVTTWSVDVDAHGDRRIGQAQADFDSRLPFRIEAKLPVEATSGDSLELPVVLIADDPSLTTAQLRVASLEGPARLDGPDRIEAALVDGRARLDLPLRIEGSGDVVSILVEATCGPWSDRIRQTIPVTRRGFPHAVSTSGILDGRSTIDVPYPASFDRDSLTASIRLFPSPLADLMDGLDGMLREPCGCFEQASSTNYPNVLAATLIDRLGIAAPELSSRCRDLLKSGYEKIAGYECSEKGYEWFGGNPGHEALTAYGLVEFTDMKAVHPVDAAMVERTREWLLSRRDGEGGYRRNSRALDSFGGAPAEVTDAYVTWSLATTGTDPDSIRRELDRLETRGLATEDPYVVALAADALRAAGRTEPARGLRTRLAGMQEADGSLEGRTTSITSSSGSDLRVETTALAALAWLPTEDQRPRAMAAIRYLLGQRRGSGTFGATQATILTLKALVQAQEFGSKSQGDGSILLRINGAIVDEATCSSDATKPIVFADFARHFGPGNNTVELERIGQGQLPWVFDMRYVSDRPADDSLSRVALRTTLRQPEIREGTTVAIDAVVENRSDRGLGMVVAVIGVPAGLEVATAVLEDLLAAGRFDAWEARGREVTLYWRGLGEGERREVTLDATARIPGSSTGAASRAWVYYSPDERVFGEPLSVRIRR